VEEEAREMDIKWSKKKKSKKAEAITAKCNVLIFSKLGAHPPWDWKQKRPFSSRKVATKCKDVVDACGASGGTEPSLGFRVTQRHEKYCVGKTKQKKHKRYQRLNE